MTKTNAPTRTRKTLALKGTAARRPAHLDYESLLVVSYAQAALSRAGSRQVPSSGVIRRALAVYRRHLEASDMAMEIRAVAGACNVFAGGEAAQKHTDALQRLAEAMAADKSQPLPSFAVIQAGARVVAERQAAHAHLEAFMAEQFPDTISTGGRA